MKKLSLPTWLQIIYFLLCVMLVICMSLYTACFDTEVGEICFMVGEFLFLLCAMNPIGIICCIWNIYRYVAIGRYGEAKHKHLLWVIIGPVLTTIAWLLSVITFVYHTGGV